MSGVSSAELLLLLVIGLIVLGPKRLPEIANKIGGWVGQARRMTRVMKRQLEEELNSSEFRDLANMNTRPPQIGTPAGRSAATPHPSDPAYDESADPNHLKADHIPRDDDSYSPVHDKKDA